MNTKTRIATLALAAMLFGSNAWAAQFDYAKVTHVEPIVNYVTVKTPVRECWTETRYVEVEHRRQRASRDILNSLLAGEPERADELSFLLEALLDGLWHAVELKGETADREKLTVSVLRFLAKYLPEHSDAILSQQ